MILMHKDDPVLEFNIYEDQTVIKQVFDVDLMPIGTYNRDVRLAGIQLKRWFLMRSIPKTRQNVEKIERALGESVSDVCFKPLAASLTDCYWIKDRDSSSAEWDMADFHKNLFGSDFSKMVFNGKTGPIESADIPDVTTDGNLEKAWAVKGGKPFLVKFGNFGPNAEGKDLLCANEVIASQLAQMMRLSHVSYEPLKIKSNGRTACVCPCFIDDDGTEFVNLFQVMLESESKRMMDAYLYIDKLGFKADLDRLLIFDYLIGNTDRHEKNIGLIRDSKSLQYISLAPLFDNGSCLGWNSSLNDLSYDSKPFISNKEEQLGLALGTRVIVPSKEKIETLVRETYEAFGISEQNCETALSVIDTNYETLKEKGFFF